MFLQQLSSIAIFPGTYPNPAIAFLPGNLVSAFRFERKIKFQDLPENEGISSRSRLFISHIFHCVLSCFLMPLNFPRDPRLIQK